MVHSTTTTSTLLLKAKHALSLHRKSSASGSAPSSSSQSSTLSSIPLPSTDSPVSPPLPNTSITPATHIDTAPTPILDNVPHKTKRSSRFKVKTFPSFRESASSLHTKTNQSSKVSRTSDLVNTVIGPGIPSQPMASVNPYSPLWCPSTVTALKSPLRNASLLRSKSNSYLDLSQISHYSPAPNLILQPSPSVDLASCYAGARSSTLPAMVRYHSTSGEFAAARGFVPVIGPQDFLSKLPYELATYILHFVDMHNLAKVALISRTWNQFAKDNEVWKSVFLHQKRWKIKIPPQQTKPLNWKMLCHDRKKLEERWTSVPSKTKLVGHTDSVYCVQFDDNKIITGSRDQTIKIWDIHTLQCIYTLRGHSQSVLCLQFNDKVMVSGSSDNSIIVWDMETRQPIRRLQGHTAGVLDVCFDDNYIVSCSKDTTIRIWDFHTGNLIRTLTGHRGPVNAVQLHKDQVVSASGDGMVKLWSVTTGQCVRDFIGHERGLACVQFDGETIVSGSNDKTIRIWEAATGRCRRVLTGHDGLVRTLHFDQNRIVSGSYDYSIKIWDMTTGEVTLDLKNGHTSWVFDVQFSARRIISTSQDRSIVVWDFAPSGIEDIDVRLFL